MLDRLNRSPSPTIGSPRSTSPSDNASPTQRPRGPSGRSQSLGQLETLTNRPPPGTALRLGDLAPRAPLPNASARARPGLNEPWMNGTRDGLLSASPDEAAVTTAHQSLTQAGYEFVGYHGTNHAAGRSIIGTGLDPSRIGSNSGTAKGSGFYAAHRRGYADEWAEASTQTGEVHPKTFVPELNQGDAGIERVTRVYAQGMSAMRPGRDVAWGLHPSAGDPHDDKKLTTGQPLNVQADVGDLEAVFSPQVYGKLAAIPSLGADGDAAAQLNQGRAKWPPHEAP